MRCKSDGNMFYQKVLANILLTNEKKQCKKVLVPAIAIFVASFEADAAVDRVRLTALQLLHQVRLLMVPD